MSTSFDQMKKTSNKCDDLNVKMKTDGKLVCGCGGDNEFDYDPNLFDCRLFGLFLRKAENSHEKFRPILSKLNLLETAIFENKETGDSSVIEQKVNNIINEFSDINLNNQKRDFIVKYMTDKTKRKEDYNRYQLMSTLQSALNYIEVARNPQMAQLLTIVSTWVSKSDKILKGVSVSQQEVNQELTLKPEDAGIQYQAKVNSKNKNSRDAGILASQGKVPAKKYDNDEKFEKDKNKVEQIMRLLTTLNKAIPEYFERLLEDLTKKQTDFVNTKDKDIYRKDFLEILYNGEQPRRLFDIFRKLNDKMNKILPSRTSEESKKTQKALEKIFNNYLKNISTYRKLGTRVTPRNDFISNLYTILLLSEELEKNPKFNNLIENQSVKYSIKARSIISDNLKKLLEDQHNNYARGSEYPFEKQLISDGKLKAFSDTIQNTGKFQDKDDSGLITALTEGKNEKEVYINFDYTEPEKSSSS